MHLSAENLDAMTIPGGAGCLTAEVSGQTFEMFTYRPTHVSQNGGLFVFDGLHRDASGLRDKAAKLAERASLTVFAPLMDRDTFPKWRYAMAGVVWRQQVQPRDHWTGALLQRLLDCARNWMGGSSTPMFLFGHSAGGQLLSRVCAYSPLSGTKRIVICNPSAYVVPELNMPVPFGFKGMFDDGEALARLQVYLALPITIYVGQKDTGDRHLSKTKYALRQGTNRLERGRHVFRLAQELANQRAWAFNWSLVETPGVGHSALAMLNAPECIDAFGMMSRTTERQPSL